MSKSAEYQDSVRYSPRARSRGIAPRSDMKIGTKLSMLTNAMTMNASKSTPRVGCTHESRDPLCKQNLVLSQHVPRREHADQDCRPAYWRRSRISPTSARKERDYHRLQPMIDIKFVKPGCAHPRVRAAAVVVPKHPIPCADQKCADDCCAKS